MDWAEYPEDGPLLSQIGESDRVVAAERHKVWGYLFAQTGVRVAIFVGALGATYATFQLGRDSFPQSLASNLAAGLLVFLAAAPVLRRIRRYPTATLAAGVLVSALVLGGAYISGPVLQSLLLNLGVGAALILALDVNIARWLDAIAHAEGASRQRLKQAAAKVEAAESTLDYKYAVHDFLGLPRPYKFGGISLAEGEPLLPFVRFANDDTLDTRNHEE